MKYLKKPHLIYLPALLLVDLLFFGLTDPAEVNSILLIIGFLLLVVTLYATLHLLGRGLSLYGVPRSLANRLMGTLSGVGALCLALSSVGELSLRDVVVMLPLAVLLYVYLFYARPARA